MSDTKTSILSIRLPETLEEVPCELCDRPFRAAGPTAYLGDDPICDACSLERDKHFGLVITMLGICRRYGAMVPKNSNEAARFQHELMGFARIYERRATAAYGLARPWEDFLALESDG